jgi:hypothetical protein
MLRPLDNAKQQGKAPDWEPRYDLTRALKQFELIPFGEESHPSVVFPKSCS